MSIAYLSLKTSALPMAAVAKESPFIWERALNRPRECNSFYAEHGYFEKDEPKMRLFTLLACLALMLGAPAPAHAAGNGKPAVDSRTFGDWKLDCIKDKNSAVSDCQL